MMRGRRTARAKHGRKHYGGVTAILLLLLVAGFIYAFQSLGIYDILSGAVSKQGTSSPMSAHTSAAAATSAAASVSTGATGTPGAKISEEIKMSKVTLFAVQLGVYSKLENAQAVSDQFRKTGSAGYLLKEDTLYRVIDSVYYSESDAKALRDELRKGSSPDACVIRINANGVNWNVKATREQIDAIRNSLLVFQSQIVALINTQKSLQQNSAAVDYAATVKSVSDKLKDAESTLKKQVGATNAEMITKLDVCLTESAAGLDKIEWKTGGDNKAFQTDIKYNIINILLNIQNKIMG